MHAEVRPRKKLKLYRAINKRWNNNELRKPGVTHIKMQHVVSADNKTLY